VPQLALTIDLDGLDPERVEESCFEFGALAVSYTDQRDDPILEPAPGEFRLWPHARLQALFPFDTSPEDLVLGLSHVLRVDAARIRLETLADRVWERDVDDDTHSFEGCESTAALAQRLTQLLDDLERRWRDKKIVLVSHGDPLQVLQTILLGLKCNQHRSLPHLENAELRKIS